MHELEQEAALHPAPQYHPDHHRVPEAILSNAPLLSPDESTV
jgi:hypothetical protein